MSTETQEESDILQVEGINSKGFGLAPKLVMLDDRLSIFSKAIYCYFSSYAGAGKIAFPKVTKIIADLKISKNTYYAHFNPLVKLGFIKVEQTRVSGKHGHNIYTLMDLIPKPENPENKPFSPCTISWDTVKRDTIRRDTITRDTITRDTIKCDTNNNSLFKNNRSINNSYDKHPPNPPQMGDADAAGRNERGPTTGEASTPELSTKKQIQSSENLKLKTGGGEDRQSSSHSMTLTDQRFEMFWEAYPKKVGKTAALKAWNHVNPDDTLYARIIASITASKTSDQWQRENGRYIPNPLTWLNQGRWDDEYPMPVTQAQQPRQSGNAITRMLAQIEADEAARENEILGDEYDI